MSGEQAAQVFLLFEIQIHQWLPWNSVWADGTDHEDSYHDQSCHVAKPHHRGTAAESPWEDLCSSISICSSDEEMKPVERDKVELYAPGGDSRAYPSTGLNMVPHSGPSAGTGPSVDVGGPPYPGQHWQIPGRFDCWECMLRQGGVTVGFPAPQGRPLSGCQDCTDTGTTAGPASFQRAKEECRQCGRVCVLRPVLRIVPVSWNPDWSCCSPS